MAATVTACMVVSASAITRPASVPARSIPPPPVKAARSAPAVKARPLPFTITALTSSWPSNHRAASVSSSRHATDSGLSLAGTSSASVPTGPSMSTVIVS